MAFYYEQYAVYDSERYEVSAEEQLISNYISQKNNDDYDRLIAEEEHWDAFYRLTRMRKSVLNWYPFLPDSSLLEIGAGFGELTGLFCDSCRKVVAIEENPYRAKQIYKRHKLKNNLTVYAGQIADIPLEEKYNYIILVGSLEYMGGGIGNRQVYADYIKNLGSLLAPEGKILLAVENRFGLKYFCGEPALNTKIPFSGINHKMHHNEGYSFSKQELSDILGMAGFHYKLYFPLPDYKLTQVVYSQEFIPNSSIKERLIPYYKRPDSLISYENDLYDDIIENKVLDFFSNSFLAECSQEPSFCDVIYAALSTDRGHDDGFATTIHSTGIVKKTPLYPEGKKQLEQILSNHTTLSNRGLHVIDSQIIDNALHMPHVKANTLSDYLKTIYKTNSELFKKQFDMLYECILKSSDHAKSVNSKMAGYDSKLEYGPILKKAYIDMIPVNCFYLDETLLFFDQEFVREYYPANYILYRALKYTYFFIPDANNYVPMKELQEKFELTLLWDSFEKVEAEFVSKNRKYDEYKNFLPKTYINKKKLLENANKLIR
jgi:SAM-dependent methyltransferase